MIEFEVRSESISENQLPVSGYDTHLALLRGRLHLGETPNRPSVSPCHAAREGVEPVICSMDEIRVANRLEEKGFPCGSDRFDPVCNIAGRPSVISASPKIETFFRIVVLNDPLHSRIRTALFNQSENLNHGPYTDEETPRVRGGLKPRSFRTRQRSVVFRSNHETTPRRSCRKFCSHWSSFWSSQARP